MAPTLIREPFHREGWLYEEKVDGYRMLAYKDRRKIRLVSGNRVDHTARYPDVAAAIGRLRAKTVMLDSEIAVFDQRLRSRFDWLRHRQPEQIATAPVLIAFDVLYLRGRDISQRPLRERRSRLEDLVDGADLVRAAWRLAGNRLEVWAQVMERGYEGLVARYDASVYEGGPTRRWLKVEKKGWTDAEDRWRRTMFERAR
jgi:bifunctional non-homologous end joining protein LigD